MKNSPARMALRFVIALCVLMTTISGNAQAPAGGTTESVPARVWSESELDNLVAPVALYPDDLLALVLPASTYPLDVVRADRFLERLKTNKDLKPDENLDSSVRNLLNYPEIVKKMSTDLDWTTQLGNAVVDDQGAVMEAVQRFRRKAYAANNLKTDDKQTVVVEDEIISLQPTKPDVIYVPQYDPVTVVVQQPATYVGAPYYGYYPTAYPSYYYPYPPGYAFASGFFWGAVGAAWAMNWHGGHVEHNVNINSNNNVNIGDGNRGQGDRGQGNRGDRNQVNPNDRGKGSDRSGRTADRGTGGQQWQPDRSNRQGGGDRAASRSQTGARPGDRGYSPRTASTFERGQSASAFNRAANTGSASNRAGSAGNRASASTRPSSSTGNRASASNRAGSSSASRASSGRSSYGGSSRSASSRGGGSMSRYSSGRTASAASSRGAGSRGGGGRGGGGRGGGRR
jgi:hypothetical protein